jgi:hypothetical protein
MIFFGFILNQILSTGIILSILKYSKISVSKVIQQRIGKVKYLKVLKLFFFINYYSKLLLVSILFHWKVFKTCFANKEGNKMAYIMRFYILFMNNLKTLILKQNIISIDIKAE